MKNIRLKNLRQQKKLTQKAFAEALGLSQSMVSQVEQGSRSFADADKVKIAQFFGVTVEWLFFAQYYCEMK